jgi:hypothetical protein
VTLDIGATILPQNMWHHSHSDVGPHPGKQIPQNTVYHRCHFLNELTIISIQACYTCLDFNKRYMDRLPDNYIYVLKNMSVH